MHRAPCVEGSSPSLPTIFYLKLTIGDNMASKKSIINSISRDEFSKIVSQSNSICDILVYFGFSRNSGSMSNVVKQRIIAEELDISHFRKSGGQGGKPKYSLDEILVENSQYTNINRLKKRLLKEGLLEYKCAKCGNDGTWLGNPLSLQLEHKNGIHNDHRIENLEFLCPNCHAQTDTYGGKNIKNKTNWKQYRHVNR